MIVVKDEIKHAPSVEGRHSAERPASIQGQLARQESLHERMRLALKAGHIGTFDFDPRTQKSSWDAELFYIWGIDPATPDIFEAARASIHPDDYPAYVANFSASLDPQGNRRHNLEMRIIRPSDGQTRWVLVQADVEFDGNEPARMIGAVRDITDVKAASAREKLLAQELNHRVKNAFSVMNGMVNITERFADTPASMGEALRGRIQAMAQAHALIQPTIVGRTIADADVPLRILCASVLAPHSNESENITIEGPDVMLAPEAASGMALVLHEWATNAVKYGGLSQIGGQVRLAWSMSEDERDGGKVRFSWTETGGPRIDGAPPDRTGFGFQLVKGTMRLPAFSDFRTRWDPEGVVYTVMIDVV